MATKVGFQLESSLASKHLTDAEFIKGGYLVVSSITERDSLVAATDSTDGTIIEGSLCYCQADNKFYQYNGTSWVEKLVSSTEAGFMSAADKSKLDGVAAGANKYEHPSTHAASMITGLADVATTGSYNDLSNKPTIPSSLKNPNSLTVKAGTETVSSYDGSAAKTFTIAASSTAGAFTVSDGTTTKTVQLAGKFTDSDTTYTDATTSKAGLMSATDKANLDTIVNSFNSDDSNTTIDTVKEVLKAFENAPEGTNIANALADKSNVGHNHEVTTATVLTGVKASGTDTFVKTISGGSGSLTSNTTATDGIKYVDSVTHSAASLTGTKTFNTDAIKDVTLSASSTSTDGPAYIESVTHTAATLGGTKTFNTDAIKSVTLSASTTSTDGPKYVESISGSAPSLTGDKTFVKTQGTFSAGTTPVSSAAPTHTSTNSGSSSGTTGTIASYSAGVLTINTTVNSGSHTHTYDKATGITLTRGTAPSLSAATTGTVGISGGSYSATTKYMKPTGTAASTGTVSISGGSITPVTKYMKKTTTAASTGTVGISGGSITPSTKYLHHTHMAASAATTGSAVTGVTSNGTANVVTAIANAEN